MTHSRLADISIRTTLRPGDMGEVIRMHAHQYHSEYGFGLEFESYVASGMVEFYQQYNPLRNRVWVCEHESQMIGFMLLMDRGDAAQLRYFIILPEYRGIGLGKHLMDQYMGFYRECGFRSSYLWTTNELPAAAALYRRHGFKLTDEKPSTGFGRSLIEQRYELSSNAS